MCPAQSRSSRKPRPRNAEATRRTLLEAATRVFAEVGFAGARVDLIAAQARVNKRMIYAYYADKAGLYREVLASRFHRVNEIARSLESGGESPRAGAEALAHWYFQLLAEDPLFVRLLVWAMLDGGRAHALLVESADAGLGLLDEVIHRGIRRGVFRRDLDPEKVKASAIGLCLGYFLQKPILDARWRRSRTPPWSNEEFMAHTSRLLFDGICTKETLKP